MQFNTSWHTANPYTPPEQPVRHTNNRPFLPLGSVQAAERAKAVQAGVIDEEGWALEPFDLLDIPTPDESLQKHVKAILNKEITQNGKTVKFSTLIQAQVEKSKSLQHPIKWVIIVGTRALACLGEKNFELVFKQHSQMEKLYSPYVKNNLNVQPKDDDTRVSSGKKKQTYSELEVLRNETLSLFIEPEKMKELAKLDSMKLSEEVKKQFGIEIVESWRDPYIVIKMSDLSENPSFMDHDHTIGAPENFCLAQRTNLGIFIKASTVKDSLDNLVIKVKSEKNEKTGKCSIQAILDQGFSMFHIRHVDKKDYKALPASLSLIIRGKVPYELQFFNGLYNKFVAHFNAGPAWPDRVSQLFFRMGKSHHVNIEYAAACIALQFEFLQTHNAASRFDWQTLWNKLCALRTPFLFAELRNRNVTADTIQAVLQAAAALQFFIPGSQASAEGFELSGSSKCPLIIYKMDCQEEPLQLIVPWDLMKCAQALYKCQSMPDELLHIMINSIVPALSHRPTEPYYCRYTPHLFPINPALIYVLRNLTSSHHPFHIVGAVCILSALKGLGHHVDGLLWGYALPKLFCGNDSRLSNFARDVAKQQLCFLAPTQAHIKIRKLLEVSSPKSWVQALITTGDAMCCKIAVDHFAAQDEVEVNALVPFFTSRAVSSHSEFLGHYRTILKEYRNIDLNSISKTELGHLSKLLNVWLQGTATSSEPEDDKILDIFWSTLSLCLEEQPPLLSEVCTLIRSLALHPSLISTHHHLWKYFVKYAEYVFSNDAIPKKNLLELSALPSISKFILNFKNSAISLKFCEFYLNSSDYQISSNGLAILSKAPLDEETKNTLKTAVKATSRHNKKDFFHKLIRLLDKANFWEETSCMCLLDQLSIEMGSPLEELQKSIQMIMKVTGNFNEQHKSYFINLICRVFDEYPADASMLKWLLSEQFQTVIGIEHWITFIRFFLNKYPNHDDVVASLIALYSSRNRSPSDRAVLQKHVDLLYTLTDTHLTWHALKAIHPLLDHDLASDWNRVMLRLCSEYIHAGDFNNAAALFINPLPHLDAVAFQPYIEKTLQYFCHEDRSIKDLHAILSIVKHFHPYLLSSSWSAVWKLSHFAKDQKYVDTIYAYWSNRYRVDTIDKAKSLPNEIIMLYPDIIKVLLDSKSQHVKFFTANPTIVLYLLEHNATSQEAVSTLGIKLLFSAFGLDSHDKERILLEWKHELKQFPITAENRFKVELKFVKYALNIKNDTILLHSLNCIDQLAAIFEVSIESLFLIKHLWNSFHSLEITSILFRIIESTYKQSEAKTIAQMANWLLNIPQKQLQMLSQESTLGFSTIRDRYVLEMLEYLLRAQCEVEKHFQFANLINRCITDNNNLNLLVKCFIHILETKKYYPFILAIELFSEKLFDIVQRQMEEALLTAPNSLENRLRALSVFHHYLKHHTLFELRTQELASIALNILALILTEDFSISTFREQTVKLFNKETLFIKDIQLSKTQVKVSKNETNQYVKLHLEFIKILLNICPAEKNKDLAYMTCLYEECQRIIMTALIESRYLSEDMRVEISTCLNHFWFHESAEKRLFYDIHRENCLALLNQIEYGKFFKDDNEVHGLRLYFNNYHQINPDPLTVIKALHHLVTGMATNAPLYILRKIPDILSKQLMKGIFDKELKHVLDLIELIIEDKSICPLNKQDHVYFCKKMLNSLVSCLERTCTFSHSNQAYDQSLNASDIIKIITKIINKYENNYSVINSGNEDASLHLIRKDLYELQGIFSTFIKIKFNFTKQVNHSVFVSRDLSDLIIQLFLFHNVLLDNAHENYKKDDAADKIEQFAAEIHILRCQVLDTLYVTQVGKNDLLITLKKNVIVKQFEMVHSRPPQAQLLCKLLQSYVGENKLFHCIPNLLLNFVPASYNIIGHLLHDAGYNIYGEYLGTIEKINNWITYLKSIEEISEINYCTNIKIVHYLFILIEQLKLSSYEVSNYWKKTTARILINLIHELNNKDKCGLQILVSALRAISHDLIHDTKIIPLILKNLQLGMKINSESIYELIWETRHLKGQQIIPRDFFPEEIYSEVTQSLYKIGTALLDKNLIYEFENLLFFDYVAHFLPYQIVTWLKHPFNTAHIYDGHYTLLTWLLERSDSLTPSTIQLINEAFENFIQFDISDERIKDYTFKVTPLFFNHLIQANQPFFVFKWLKICRNRISIDHFGIEILNQLIDSLKLISKMTIPMYETNICGVSDLLDTWFKLNSFSTEYIPLITNTLAVTEGLCKKMPTSEVCNIWGDLCLEQLKKLSKEQYSNEWLQYIYQIVNHYISDKQNVRFQQWLEIYQNFIENNSDTGSTVALVDSLFASKDYVPLVKLLIKNPQLLLYSSINIVEVIHSLLKNTSTEKVVKNCISLLLLCNSKQSDWQKLFYIVFKTHNLELYSFFDSSIVQTSHQSTLSIFQSTFEDDFTQHDNEVIFNAFNFISNQNSTEEDNEAIYELALTITHKNFDISYLVLSSNFAQQLNVGSKQILKICSLLFDKAIEFNQPTSQMELANSVQKAMLQPSAFNWPYLSTFLTDYTKTNWMPEAARKEFLFLILKQRTQAMHSLTEDKKISWISSLTKYVCFLHNSSELSYELFTLAIQLLLTLDSKSNGFQAIFKKMLDKLITACFTPKIQKPLSLTLENTSAQYWNRNRPLAVYCLAIEQTLNYSEDNVESVCVDYLSLANFLLKSLAEKFSSEKAAVVSCACRFAFCQAPKNDQLTWERLNTMISSDGSVIEMFNHQTTELLALQIYLALGEHEFVEVAEKDLYLATKLLFDQLGKPRNWVVLGRMACILKHTQKYFSRSDSELAMYYTTVLNGIISLAESYSELPPMTILTYLEFATTNFVFRLETLNKFQFHKLYTDVSEVLVSTIEHFYEDDTISHLALKHTIHFILFAQSNSYYASQEQFFNHIDRLVPYFIKHMRNLIVDSDKLFLFDMVLRGILVSHFEPTSDLGEKQVRLVYKWFCVVGGMSPSISLALVKVLKNDPSIQRVFHRRELELNNLKNELIKEHLEHHFVGKQVVQGNLGRYYC